MDGTPSQPADSAAELHFEGKPAAGHTLPAETLAGYLTSLQRLVLLEAARQRGLPLAKKFRASASLKEHHVLRCGIPTEGGYRQPLIEVNESAQQTTGGDPAVIDNVLTFIQAVADDDSTARRKAVASGRHEQFMLREVETLGRLADGGLTVEILNGHARPIRIDDKLQRLARDARVVQATPGAPEPGDFVGKLLRDDFESNELTLRHPVTDREIKCHYTDEAITDLSESRLEHVHVIGEVTRDGSGEVIRLSEVTSVEPVHVGSDLELNHFLVGERRLRLDPPLKIIGTPDEETGQLLTFEAPELDLIASGPTFGHLCEDVRTDLAFAWQTYAEADDATLAPDAIQLKNELLRRIHPEVSDRA